MEYKIDNPFYESMYSKEEVQALINEKKISFNTKVWKSEWNEWKKLKDTDFVLSKSKIETNSDLPENLFLSIKLYLSFIDYGHIFRKPFSLLYTLMAIINLIFPFYLIIFQIKLYLELKTGMAEINKYTVFDSDNKIIISIILGWIVIAFASWVSFQLWWDRKTKIIFSSNENDEFVATPVFSHLLQTFGEWIGTWIGIVGFCLIVLYNIIHGQYGTYLSYEFFEIRIISEYLRSDWTYGLLMPFFGFLVIFLTRLLAEQIKALSVIANNTKTH